MFDWLLQNARLEDDEVLKDVALRSGIIAAIEPAQTSLRDTSRVREKDLNGRVLLPGFVDCHTHLDKTYSILDNQSGSLEEAIDVWHAYHPTRTAEDIYKSAERALKTAIKNGVTAMRSHIDIGMPQNLLAVEVLLDLRQSYQHKIELQFVALGTSAGKPEWKQGMVEALNMGVDLIGGCPALCPNPKEEIDAVFELAEQTGKAIDLHMDETEDPNMLSLEILAEKTLETGMQGRVTAGHCCSLGFADKATRKRVIDTVAQAGITIITLPSCNLVLMGRGQHPVPRGITPVKQLLAAGIPVCAASDNVGDPFNPFGSYDLLQIANLNAHVAHMTGRDELYESLEMVTNRPRHCMRQDADAGIQVGGPADLVVADCCKKLEAVLAPPAKLATFKAGSLTAETTIEHRYV